MFSRPRVVTIGVAMYSIALIGMGLQAVVSIAVGLRLLGLARRTRRFPELALSLQTLLPWLGYPFVLAAVALERWELPGVASLFFIAMCVMMVAIAMNYFFTWQVFRAGSAWAVILCGVGSCLLVGPVGAIVANIQVHGIDAGVRSAHGWTLLLVSAASAAYGWTVVEAFHYFVQTRRRLRLGLADAAVCNRFLLWALASAAWLSLTILSSFMLVLGVNPMHDEIFNLGLGVTGLLNSVCMKLCFMPPERYLDWLRRRALALQEA